MIREDSKVTAKILDDTYRLTMNLLLYFVKEPTTYDNMAVKILISIIVAVII